MSLAAYAAQWLEMQTSDESTREAQARRLRVHILPDLGATPLAALRATQVQSWLRSKQITLAPSTVRVVFGTLSAVMASAVDDDRIAKNPCQAGSVRLPKRELKRIVPWSASQVALLHEALPDRYQAALIIAAGLGLRQGEVFGLAVNDIDFLGGVVHVRRQVKIVGSRLVFALPKGHKTRSVPLSSYVARELAKHLVLFPPTEAALPWDTKSGELVRAKLVLTSREHRPLNRNYVNGAIWKPALRASGLPDTRENGMHAARHFFASTLLDGGTNVRALSEYLGHSDPGFTLRTYTHLMPASEDRTKRAVDGMFERLENAVNGSQCVPDVSQQGS
ncbi:MAG TPA: site-specific integrase [Acidothermaceae bacterium]